MESFHLVMKVPVLVTVVLILLLIYQLMRRQLKQKEFNLAPFFEAISIYSPSLMIFRDTQGKLINNELMDAEWAIGLNQCAINSDELIMQDALKGVHEFVGKKGPTIYYFTLRQPKRVVKISTIPVYDSSSKFCGLVDFVLDVTLQQNCEKQLSFSKKSLDFSTQICYELMANLYGEIDFYALALKISAWYQSGFVHLWRVDMQNNKCINLLPLTAASPVSIVDDKGIDGSGSFSNLVKNSLANNNDLFVNCNSNNELSFPFEWKGEKKNFWILPISSPNSRAVGVMVMANLVGKPSVNANNVKLASTLVGLMIAIAQRNKLDQKALLNKKEELQRLANLMDNLPGVVYTCKNTPRWDMLFLSHGIEELTGYSVNEIINGVVYFVQIIHPDDRVKVAREVEMRLAESNSFQLTYRIVTKNNEVKWVWERGKANGFNSSGVMLLEGIIIDISQQIEADQRATANQSFINTMVNALPFHINVVNKAGQVKKRRFQSGDNNHHIFTNQFEGKHITDIVAAEAINEVGEAIKQVIEHGGVADIEARILPLEPSRWFESRMVKIGDDEALVFSRDITERKQNDAKVAESELLFRSLFDMGNIAMGIIERDGTFSLVNSKLSLLLEIQPDDNSHLNWYQIIIPEETDYDKRVFSRLENGELKSYQSEKRLVKSNGTVVYTHFTLFLLKNEYLQSVKFIASFIDISDRMNLERRVLNTMIDTEEKERVRVARELHDGVGPLLSSLKMYLQWMQMKDSKANKQELMADAETLIDQTLQTIRDISFNLSPHLLQNYGLVVAVESFIGKVKGVGSINFHFNPNGLTGRLNEESEVILYRALTECINNTLKYAQAHNVFIDFIVNDGVLCVSYRDDGIGFDASEVLNRKTGMGLFNMQSRLKAINGKVSFKSEKGKGCHIDLELNI
jgi:PAS domain S-box-containing protein